MTDPIDILAIAASRLHAAREALMGTKMLNASAGAGQVVQFAIARFNIAQADMDAVQSIALEIARDAPVRGRFRRVDP